jgi:uncharacterized protein (DUF2384 family)
MAAAAETLEAFLSDVREPGKPWISPTRFARRLNLEQQQLAQLARVHRNTVTRMPDSTGLQKYLKDAIRVLAAATDLSGDVERALFWFQNHPLSTFDYQTADVLVSQGRADHVIDYIESLQAGTGG